MMSNNFLITRPDHDDRLTYLYNWSKDILAFAKEKNIKFSDFSSKRANKEQVKKYIEKQNPELIIFNGHGTESEIFGYEDKTLIKLNDNDDLLKDKIIYAIACNCASKLGVEVTCNNKGAFIGFEEAFVFVKDSSRECSPSKDKFAEPFKKFSNEVSLSLLKGKTAKESYNNSQKVASQLLSFYSTSDALSEYKDIRFWLFWDKCFQRLYGNEDIKFIE